MARYVAIFVGTAQRLLEERRIGKDGIVSLFWHVVLKGGVDDGDVLADRGVFPGLLAGFCIDVDARDVGIGIALRHHQGTQPRARADVEDAAVAAPRKGSKEDTVGAHLHGATVVAHIELFELESFRHGDT